MASVQSVHSLNIHLPPSCAEFWPEDPRYLVVGTYNLEKNEGENGPAAGDVPTDHKIEEGSVRSQERNGSLILLRVVKDNVTIVHTLATDSAVLDLHFVPLEPTRAMFGVAFSAGTFGLYRIVTDGDVFAHGCGKSSNESIIQELGLFRLTSPNVLVTAFVWYQYMASRPEGVPLQVYASLSSGDVVFTELSLFAFDRPSLNAQVVGHHDLEAWTVATSIVGGSVYSGGDDSALICWEHFQSEQGSAETGPDLDTPVALWTDRKTHGAGVTAIMPLKLPNDETVIITGSYDDHIRLLKVSDSGRRQLLTECNLGGGVWRLKLLESEGNSFRLLASCMHAGARILGLSQNDSGVWSFDVLAKFQEHKSMNYGSDCQPKPDRQGRRTFVTTSFYDRLVCLWRF